MGTRDRGEVPAERTPAPIGRAPGFAGAERKPARPPLTGRRESAGRGGRATGTGVRGDSAAQPRLSGGQALPGRSGRRLARR